MNSLTRTAAACLLSLFATLAIAHADIAVKVSVKFIHNNDPGNTRPSGNIGTSVGFGQEITYGNTVLEATSRGYSINVVEYLDITPPAPTATPANVTGSIMNNSTTVTCGNTAGLQNFMRVQGTGIPANSVILSINPNTSFTMSGSATATTSSVAITASFPPDHWFNLPARDTRQYIETTALASQATWAWNAGAINIYVNNSVSGSCSFVGNGSSISLGGTIGTGTVLHEIGHLMNLLHTHALDYATNTNPPANMPPGVFTMTDLMDGDGLIETVNDNPNITTNDQLCQALFGKNYNGPTTTDAERAAVDSAFQNVMSYHNEAVLLSVQMDLWTLNSNGARLGFCTGRTWFVAKGGSDGASGADAGAPFSTITRALDSVGPAADVVLLRNGTYTVPAGGVISRACTLRATRGPVTVLRP